MMNIIILTTIIESQKYSSNRRQFLLSATATATQMNRINDLIIVIMLNAIAFSSTYSSLDNITLKLRKVAAKSQNGQRQKYNPNP